MVPNMKKIIGVAGYRRSGKSLTAFHIQNILGYKAVLVSAMEYPRLLIHKEDEDRFHGEYNFQIESETLRPFEFLSDKIRLDNEDADFVIIDDLTSAKAVKQCKEIFPNIKIIQSLHSSVLTVPAISESKRVDKVFDYVDGVVQETTNTGFHTRLTAVLKDWGFIN